MDDLIRRACLAESDIDVAPSIRQIEEMRNELGHRPYDDIDVVIAGVSDRSATGLPRALLERHPRTRVLLLELHGGIGALYELIPHHERLGPMSPSEIVRVVRDDATRAEMWDELDLVQFDGAD